MWAGVAEAPNDLDFPASKQEIVDHAQARSPHGNRVARHLRTTD